MPLLRERHFFLNGVKQANCHKMYFLEKGICIKSDDSFIHKRCVDFEFLQVYQFLIE